MRQSDKNKYHDLFKRNKERKMKKKRGPKDNGREGTLPSLKAI